MNGRKAVATKRGAAERLVALEGEERRLSARMQRDRARRNVLAEEIRELRVTMPEAEHARYRRLVFQEERLP